MKSRRPVSVHLLLDAQSVYNEDYHKLKLSLGLKYGAALSADHKSKLDYEKQRKNYEPSAGIGKIIREISLESFCVEADDELKARLLSRNQQLAAVKYVNSSSLTAARSVLEQFPDDVNNGLANLVERLPSSLQHELFLQANQRLVLRLEADVSQGATVFVANGTPRQYNALNQFDKLTQDTGCLFADLQALTTSVRKRAKNPATVALDALTMYDVINKLPDGEHYKHTLAAIQQFSYNPKNKQPALVSIFLHAHYHAVKHSDFPVDLHCYVSSAAALEKLMLELAEHQDLMPAAVTIRVHQYHGELQDTIEFRGTAKADEHYRQHAISFDKNPVSKAVVKSLPSPDKYSVNLLDADNCIYNVYYFHFLTLIVEKYGDKISASKNADMKSEDMVAFGKEMLAFVHEYPIDDLINDVTYHTVIRKRDPLVEKFKELALDEDIIQTRAAMQADNASLFDKNQHGPVFCQFIRLIEAVYPAIITSVIYRTNDILFDDMIKTAKSRHAKNIVNMIGSLRQSYDLDLRNSVWNGTGRFHADMIRLNSVLNACYADSGFVFTIDITTISDYSFKLVPGIHINCESDAEHQKLEIANDADKIRIAYVMMHHAYRKYHATEIDFFDDSNRVFCAIHNAFGRLDQYRLLPVDMTLNMHGYNGDFMNTRALVTGGGSVDQFPHALTQYTSFTPSGIFAVHKNRLSSLPGARKRETPAIVSEFVELIRWCQPAMYAPVAVKTANKIKHALECLQMEIKRFDLCSGHVKHGLYAHKKPVPQREITEKFQDIANGGLTLADGLAKIILLSDDHKPIQHAATKLRNLVCGSGNYESAKTRIMKR